MRLWTSLLLTMMGTLIAAAALAMKPRFVYMSIMGCTWLVMLTAVLWVYNPQFNERYPIKLFAADIHDEVTPDLPLRLCGPLNDLALRFNLGQFVPALPELPEVTRYLQMDGEVFCVIDDEAYQRLSEGISQPSTVVARRTFDRAALLLISNRRR
jgi:hypothetical protein